jgi:hypothetical protein
MRIFEIIFESALVGARQPLYHTTPLPAAIKILRSGHIKPGWNGTVSLTRDINYQIQNDWTDDSNPHLITFVIDQNRLRQHARIQPYNYTGNPADLHADGNEDLPLDREEAEERVKKIIPISNISGVRVPEFFGDLDGTETDELGRMINQFLDLAEKYNLIIDYI